MTICNFCKNRFFNFANWNRNTPRDHHDSSDLWAAGVRECSLCLAVFDAIKHTYIDALRQVYKDADPRPFEQMLDWAFLHWFSLPLYEVVLYERAARDQWELDFRPKLKRNIRVPTELGKDEVVFELPTITFKVYAKYYHSVRPTPKPVDVKQRFEAFRRRQKTLDQDQSEEVVIVEDLKAVNMSDDAFISQLPTHVTNSRGAFDQCREWLRGCEQHERCKGFFPQTDFMPSRLLEIGTSGNTIKLIDTDRDTIKDERDTRYCRYATLSHCWGGFVSPTLSMKNMPDMKRSIALASLPLNFRHAVEAARELGIEYIWIDSLCIIQDSLVDKHAQLPEMHNIYSCSFLNIAAASSRNSHQGLFRDRRLGLLLSEVDVNGVPCVITRKDFWTAELLSQPLYTRAWVLQERTLAPRTLHFGRQMFWQCLDATACETMPRGIPHTIDGGRKELNWRRLLHQQTFSRQDRVNLQGIWQHLVGSYKGCAITDQSDALKALDGLVTKMASITKEEYYVGLWQNNLVDQLAWRVTKPNLRYNSNCGAPSWSWASMDAPVILPPRVLHNKDEELKLLDCHCEILMKEQVEVRESWLEVEGSVFGNQAIGVFYPDVKQLEETEAVLPLYYETIDGSVTGWALAIESVAGEEVPYELVKEMKMKGKIDAVYKRIGLVEWRSISEYQWGEFTQGKVTKKVVLI